MVVVVIMGVIVTMTTLALSTSEDQKLQQEAERLATLIQLAAEEAILDSKELSLAVEETGYRFEQLVDYRWQPLPDDEMFRPRALPETFELELVLEGEQMALERKDDSEEDAGDEETVADEGDEEEDKPVARVLILSSGEISPFELFVGTEEGDKEYRIAMAALGKVKLELVE